MKMRNLLLLSLAMSFTAVAGTPIKSKKFPTQRLEANLGEGCRFAVTLLGKKGTKSPIDSSVTGAGGDPVTHAGGIVAAPHPAPWKSSMTALGLGVRCHDRADPASSNTDTIYGGAKYNKSKETWEKDLDSWFVGDSPVGEDRQVLDKATRLVNVVAVNAKGYAQLLEDTTGDETGRRRSMYFCLFNKGKALCGDGTVAQLADGPRGDLTKYALDMLRSIEFLEDTSVTAKP